MYILLFFHFICLFIKLVIFINVVIEEYVDDEGMKCNRGLEGI